MNHPKHRPGAKPGSKLRAPIVLVPRKIQAPPPAPGIVARASERDLAYVVKVQKAHHWALGFIPRVALEQKIELGRIWLATDNGEPAGFLHHGSLAKPEVRVFQAAIQYDARRRHLGLALVDDLVQRARAAGARALSLRCLSELDANTFWRAAGFRLLDTEPGARGTLNVWGRLLDDPAVPNETGMPTAMTGPLATSDATRAFPFHSRLHPCPRCGRWTTDTWASGARRFSACPACVKG